MITSNQKLGITKQNGIALLVLIIILVLTISAYYFSSISIIDIESENQQKTQLVLKKAKKALLDYAVAHWGAALEAGKLGKLPCPDYISTAVTEGEQDGMCGNAYANAIGFLPWRTLGMEVPKDGSGNCLIYAVSPAYKTTPVAALNPDSYGQLQTVDDSGAVLQGANPEDRLVAVIIAPGKPLPAQVRNADPNTICGSDYGNIAAYLDNDGTTDNTALDTGVDNIIDRFVHRYPGSEEAASPLNDRIITISYKEFWSVLQSTITSTAFNDRMENLTEAIARCFAAYGSANGNHLPMPAPLDLNGGEYRKSSDYTDSGDFTAGFAGRLPYSVMQSNAELGNSDANNIFSNAYCEGIELITTAAADNINFSDDTGGDKGEYFDLWSNWKDHFFYAISKRHNPDATVGPCSGECVRVGMMQSYAGIVFFSGLKRAGQQRYSPSVPGDGAKALDGVDDKDDVVNYLENGNAADFPDNDGDNLYTTVDTATSNDIMFCIKTDMSVVAC